MMIPQYALINNARNVVYTYQNYKQDDIPTLLTRLRKTEIPSKFLFLDKLPLTQSKKPDKVRLKKLFQERT